MVAEQILQQIKSRLETAYGDRLRGVVLYGSEARGQSDPDSDIDVLVLLDGEVTTWKDIKASSEALYPLMLEIGRTIDAKPVDVAHYEKADAPLYINAQREGIKV
jgi:predicted nucleotidyltransferase